VKILIDTDILLDVALHRESFFAASALVLDWAEGEPGQACVAWHSLSNLAYLIRPDARDFIRDLLQFVEVAPVGTAQALQAIGFPMKDIEDALQAAAALSFDADFIVTRNLPHYKTSPAPPLSPVQFTSHLKHV
jgi:predicted nucleic acid-binding protein